MDETYAMSFEELYDIVLYFTENEIPENIREHMQKWEDWLYEND